MGIAEHRSPFYWQKFLLGISLFFLIGLSVASYGTAVYLRELTPQLHFLVILEGVGTVTTLLFIWSTVNQVRTDRQVTRHEARIEREFQTEMNKKALRMRELQVAYGTL